MHYDYESDSDDELPAGWEVKTTQDCNVYFVNTLTKQTQWTHPRTGKKKIIPKEMPHGWIQKNDENGRIIYVHMETNKMTYTDPRLAFAKDAKAYINDFRQRFDSFTTAYQVLHGRDLSGKLAVITGANTGIGMETAKSLARHGCKVILACRNLEATNNTIDNILKEINVDRNNLIVSHLDLASLKSVKNSANGIKLLTNRIDILILNAGVFGLPYSETEDGYETIFQVNHLGHLYYTILLEPLLNKSSRVIFVSSESHRFASFKGGFSEISLSAPEEKFSSMGAYNNSKLFNILTAKYLSECWLRRGICVNSLHPGNMVYSNLSNSWWLYRLLFYLVRPFTKSLQQAAATSVYCATAEELEGVTGVYFNNCFHCKESYLAQDRDIINNVIYLSLKMIEHKMGRDGIEKYLNELRKDAQNLENRSLDVRF